MTLKDRLQAYRQHQQETVPATILEILSRNTSMLQQQHIKNNALTVGGIFPDFTLPDSDGQNCSLKELIRHGPTVISFYRGGWCPYCVIELKALSELVERLPAVNATMVAITPEHSSHAAATKTDNQLNLRILSDDDNVLARSCGLVFSITEDLKAQYDNFGIDICDRHQNDHFELPIPATFIVDEHARIRFAFVEEDYISRAEPSDIIKTLASL